MTRARAAVGIAAVLVCLASTAYIVAGTVSVHRLHSTTAASNHALVDVGGTRDLARQVQSAMTTLWSYDYRDLDQSKTDAAKLGTKGFTKQYASVFANILELAPEQKAVVTATVTQVAVQRLHGDKATAIVFLSQSATKAGSDTPSTAAARLKVGMQRQSGTWKVASVVPF
ncbi:hypothetical protein [Nocardioides marmorisolisilvae]|uniref:SnoaL-like domain-containing protein n=1 Tax=Nocardioides marmorisolisilvae TaxID=1542737 RepID=A0A3N0DX50_9ACTN|nr:hypothetical protein [Nocardioides marmorisolisilvae]RNL80167.1 hypothetical protein EFL95_14795 [Nocardioides marmorisolisilvae]